MPDNATYEAWDLEALSDLPNYQKWIVVGFLPYLKGEAAEIGAGTGTFSRRLLAHVERLDLVEPASNMVSRLQSEFSGNVKIAVISKPIEDYLTDGRAASRDSVVLVNVLEHVKDDARALTGIFRLLRPGGHLLLFVPAVSWLFSAMDVALGHHRRYRKGDLAGLVKAAGFDIVSARYFDILGVVPWWVVYTLGKKTRFNPGMSRLYDRLFVPVGRALESLFPPPLGKNVLLVARKPETIAPAQQEQLS